MAPCVRENHHVSPRVLRLDRSNEVVQAISDAAQVLIGAFVVWHTAGPYTKRNKWARQEKWSYVRLYYVNNYGWVYLF